MELMCLLLVVSARTFMRLFTSRIKLVTADEPSSALCPEAEYRLFANLRKERKGRTMIFVTHLSRHLMKHADLIVYVFLVPWFRVATSADLGDHNYIYQRWGYRRNRHSCGLDVE